MALFHISETVDWVKFCGHCECRLFLCVQKLWISEKLRKDIRVSLNTGGVLRVSYISSFVFGGKYCPQVGLGWFMNGGLLHQLQASKTLGKQKNSNCCVTVLTILHIDCTVWGTWLDLVFSLTASCWGSVWAGQQFQSEQHGGDQHKIAFMSPKLQNKQKHFCRAKCYLSFFCR